MKIDIYLSVFTIFNYEESLNNVSHYIMTYVFPTLALLAVVGNTLLVVSILSDNLRKKTTGLLLASSNAVSIIFTIASLCIVYYPWINITFSGNETGSSCNILVFSYHTLATWSVYLLTCACVERCIAICHPMSKYAVQSQNSMKQSFKIILGTSLASSLLNCPMIWFSGLTTVAEIPGVGNLTFCHYFKDNWYMCFHEYIEMTFYSIVPFFIISFCNLAIIRKTYFHKRLLEKFETPLGGKSIDCKNTQLVALVKPKFKLNSNNIKTQPTKVGYNHMAKLEKEWDEDSRIGQIDSNIYRKKDIGIQSTRNGSTLRKPLQAEKSSQAFKLATILLPVSFLHLLFSLVVVVSIILEATVTDKPCDKLLLLIVSYNSAQLQAGFHFYIDIAVSPVFRRIFGKLFQRKPNEV